MKTTSKILAFLLVAALCVGFIPMYASAAVTPAISLVATTPSKAKNQIEVTVNVNNTYLTSVTQLAVTYDSKKVTYEKCEVVSASKNDIYSCDNDATNSKVIINYAFVDTACTGRAFYKLYFTIKSGASGACAFKLTAKSAYFAAQANGDGVKTNATLNGASCNVPSVTSIKIESRPAAGYTIGEITALDLKKFSVKATFSNGFSEVLSISSCTYKYSKRNATGKFTDVKFDGKTAGTYRFTVSYGGRTADFDFTVGTESAKSISIETLPTVTRYVCKSGDTLDLSGLVLKVTMADGSTSSVRVTSPNMEDLVVNGFDINTAGKQTITVSYKRAETAFDVMVGNILGDIDGDATISSADARLALRASVGLETLDEIQSDAADVDKDGDIASADARLILRCSVGLEEL